MEAPVAGAGEGEGDEKDNTMPAEWCLCVGLSRWIS